MVERSKRPFRIRPQKQSGTKPRTTTSVQSALQLSSTQKREPTGSRFLLSLSPSAPLKMSSLTSNYHAFKLLAFASAILIAVITACSSEPPTPTPTTQREPTTYSGEESFQNRCAVCHGQQADGTATGPPLVNRLYEIGHHPNFSFHNAVNNGVIAHHWNFGNMPPIPNVDSAEIDAIICHVRDLQRAQSIQAGQPC